MLSFQNISQLKTAFNLVNLLDKSGFYSDSNKEINYLYRRGKCSARFEAYFLSDSDKIYSKITLLLGDRAAVYTAIVSNFADINNLIGFAILYVNSPNDDDYIIMLNEYISDSRLN
jgi:uncharacterized protein with ParB-like and HNH nuclease domain